MAKVSIYNMEGSQIGEMELNDAVFGVAVNEHLVHMAVMQQLANNRQGTQSAKTRSAVSGGGRKPWTGFDESSPVDRRRRSVRTPAQKLQLQAEPERKAAGFEVRSDFPRQ